MSEATPKQIGPYEILDKLGRGGMAVVYRGVQTSLNRQVAVKVLSGELSEDPTSIERFHREAQAVALLNHPNIVQIIDKGEEEGLLYYAMEYVEGDSLHSVLEQRRLSFTEALRVFKGIALGLEYAHQRKVVHRDLNPRNVLVSKDLSTVKLADFGICRVEAISREAGTLSTSEVSMGTLHYLAPEQAMDMRRSDHRSDIFSLGVLLYEMLTGTVPVGSFTLPSRLNKEVPPGIDPIVLKCLATNPVDRYASVSEILTDLKKLEESLRLRLVDELKGFSRSTSRIIQRSTQTFAHRQRWYALGGAVAVAGLALVIWAVTFGPWQGVTAGLWSSRPAGPSSVAESQTEGENRTGVGESHSDEPVDAATADGSPSPSGPAPAAGTPPSSPRHSPPASSRAAVEAWETIQSSFDSGTYAQALTQVQDFLQAHPDGLRAGEAHLLKAEVLHELGRHDQEKAAYEEAMQRFPAGREETEAKYRLGDWYRSQKPDGWETEAIALFSDVIERPNPRVPAALARLSDVQGMVKLKTQDAELGEVPASLPTLRRLVTEFPNSPEAENAFWSLANLFRSLGHDARAAAVFEELGRRFPDSRWDGWWEAAELYDSKLKDAEKAEAAYRRVSSSSRNYEKAQRRLKKFEQ